MLIQKFSDIRYSEITPKSLLLNRRKFLRQAAWGAAGAGAAWVAGREAMDMVSPRAQVLAGAKLAVASKSPFSTTEPQTSFNDVTHYNNFYEFGTDKSDPARDAQSLRTSPWEVSIEGEVKNPMKLSMDDIMKIAPLEERIYRHRCVEAWSIVVPWIGYPLSALLNKVEPTSKAKYVAFQSLFDPRQMPKAQYAGIPFPYVEGLRLDEAMHPLAILCVGMYGEALPNQDGAPVRTVIPWKYGFKSTKSIVKIRLVKNQPATTWSTENPAWYGFYSNVNPNVNPVRWSQATEHRLGGGLFARPIPTQMFNGYGDQVAHLYAGMDLRKNI